MKVSKELEYAVDNGISPVEHMMIMLDKVSKGGDAEVVASIFGDKQVLEFIRPMLANMDDYPHQTQPRARRYGFRARSPRCVAIQRRRAAR